MEENNQKLEEKYKEKLEKNMNLFRKELIEDIVLQMEAYKIRLLENYKNEEDEKKNEQEWRQTPLYKKIGIIAGESVRVIGIMGLGVGFFSLLFYLFNENSSYNQKKKQTYEIQKLKETYGIEVFYDRRKELITEINNLENKIKYEKPQNSIKYTQKINSLKEQYSYIKDGIEYLLINESDDAKKIMGP